MTPSYSRPTWPKVLVVTNMYPTSAAPAAGTFIRDHVESVRALGVPIELVHVDRRGEGRTVYRRLRARIREHVAASHPDLVHVMYGGVTAEIVTRATRDTPVLISFYGTDLLGGRERSPVTRLRRGLGVRASRRAAVRAAGIIVQARVLGDALPASVDRDRVWTVASGVDLERFAPRDGDACRRRLGWKADVRHIAFPWSATRVEKRYPLAAAAVAELRRRGVTAELHAFENVPHEDVPAWLNGSDALLLTSTHEGSPNAVKEALACNVPVVSVDVGDVRERLEGLRASAVAAPTPEGLASALERALSQPRLAEGRPRVEGLALPRIAARIAEIYTAVAEG